MLFSYICFIDASRFFIVNIYSLGAVVDNNRVKRAIFKICQALLSIKFFATVRIQSDVFTDTRVEFSPVATASVFPGKISSSA